MTRNCIEALVTTGPKEGNTVLIPRLLLTPSDMDKYLPFTLYRCQFPIRAAYAMTINKSQGQTLESAGVYLKKSVFTHGQLYTSLSRTGSPDGMIVLADRDENGKMYTDNVVYREVLI
jgi:ATP-dependent DNA helicase PIF1